MDMRYSIFLIRELLIIFLTNIAYNRFNKILLLKVNQVYVNLIYLK